MKNIFETLDENYILFEKIKINIIIDNTDKIWFNGKELTSALEYKDTKDAIKSHIDKNDRTQLKNINHSIDTNQHPNSIYINESGLYKLMFSSKMKKAKTFTNWITNEVLPSIRKYGYYKMKKSYENEKNNLLDRINYIEKQNALLITNMKKEKFKNGAVVYIIDYSDEDKNLDGIYRLGSTDNMKKRKQIYDTHMLNKKKVIIKEFTDKPLQLENCIKSMLYGYRYKNKKDFYICKESDIKKAFKRRWKYLDYNR